MIIVSRILKESRLKNYSVVNSKIYTRHVDATRVGIRVKKIRIPIIEVDVICFVFSSLNICTCVDLFTVHCSSTTPVVCTRLKHCWHVVSSTSTTKYSFFCSWSNRTNSQTIFYKFSFFTLTIISN